MECHEEAVSPQAPQPTGRGRDECLRVNTARTSDLAETKGDKLATAQVSQSRVDKISSSPAVQREETDETDKGSGYYTRRLESTKTELRQQTSTGGSR